MAVTLYRQVGKGKTRRSQKVNLGRGRRPADLTGPYFLRYSHANGTRPWESVGDTSMRRSTPRSASRHTSKLSMQTFPLFNIRTNPVGRKSLMLCFSGSPSFNFFRAKTNKARAKKLCELTTTVSGSSSILPPSKP
jgi:hypothetical protein